MSSLKLVIGNKNYSSWSLRPWIAMRKMGLEFEEILIPLDEAGTAAAIARHSPAGRVPVLIDGEIHIWDSLAIVEYLAESHPELWPSDPALRALARSISAEMHSGFTALRDELPMNIRATGRRVDLSEAAKRDIARICELLKIELDRSGGPWLFGDFSIADAMYAPVIWRFRTYDISVFEPIASYSQHLINDPAMQEWVRAAKAETWIVAVDEAGQ